jgi:hypothetical protein
MSTSGRVFAFLTLFRKWWLILLIDVNRQRVIEGGYATSIIKLFGNPAVVHVSIPVIYNICADYGMLI